MKRVNLFSVTYDITSEASAVNGEVESKGWVCQDVSLREALHFTREGHGLMHIDSIQNIECDSAPCIRPRWITFTYGADICTGNVERRSLVIHHSLTDSSARRIARLCGVPAHHLRAPPRVADDGPQASPTVVPVLVAALQDIKHTAGVQGLYAIYDKACTALVKVGVL